VYVSRDLFEEQIENRSRVVRSLRFMTDNKISTISKHVSFILEEHPYVCILL